MNKSFKVVFSKARSALMVVNEATSSIQAKGTKTVIAVAAAMVAGGAMAAIPTGAVEITDSQAMTTPAGKTAADHAALVVRPSVEQTFYYSELSYGNSAKVDGVTLSYMAQGKDEGGQQLPNQLRIIGGTVSGFDVSLKESTGTGNFNTGLGGSVFEAIAIPGAALNVLVEGVTFADNHATARGGVGFISGVADFKIQNSIHTGNKVDADGGVYQIGNQSTGTITGSTFSGNSAEKSGGALRVSNSTVTIDKSVFDGNTAKVAGGAIKTDNTSSLTITNSSFTNNVVGEGKTGHGGAVYVSGTTPVTVDASEFTGNKAGHGGAFYIQGQTATFTDTVFTNNEAYEYGGALRVNTGNVTFNVTKGDVAYTGNKAGIAADSVAGQRYNGKTGGFLYLQSAAVANGSGAATFDVADGATLTIGKDATADSIASYSKTGAVSTITKTGAGDLVVNGDMSAFVGNLTVSSGSMTIAGGIGEYDLAVQEAVNNLVKDGNAPSDSGVATTVTVADQAALTVGNLTVTKALAVNANGDFTAGNITVAKTTYKDLKVSTGEEAFANGFSTSGAATITVAKTAKAGDITVDAGTFTKSGSGSLTAGNATVNADKGLAVSEGTLTVKNFTTGASGSATVGNTGTLEVTGTITGEKQSLNVSGSLATALNNVVDYANGTASKKTNAVVNITNGSFVVTDEGMQYTKAQWDSIKTAAGSNNLKIANGTLVAADAKTPLTLADVGAVQGYAGAADVVEKLTTDTDTYANTAITVDTTIGKLTVQAKDGATKKLANVSVAGTENHKFTLRGNAKGEVFAVPTDVKAIDIGYVYFGEKAADHGVVANGLTVSNKAGVDAGSFDFTGDVELGALFTVNKGATARFLGDVTEKAAPTVDLRSVTDADKAIANNGTVVIGTVPAADATDKTLQINVTTETGNGGLTVFGAKHEAAALQYKAAAADNNVIYVGEQTTLNKSQQFGALDTTATAPENVVAIDLDSVAANGYTAKSGAILKAATDVTITDSAINNPSFSVDLLNLNSKVLTIAETGATLNLGTAFAEGTAVKLGNAFYNDGRVAADGTFAVVTDEEAVLDVETSGLHTAGAVVQAVRSYEKPTNGIAAIVYNNWEAWNQEYKKSFFEQAKAAGLLNDHVTLEEFDPETSVATGKQAAFLQLGEQIGNAQWTAITNAEHAATNMAVLGGAFTTTLDVNDQVTAVLNRRMSLANLNVSRNETGVTPWVDVFGTMNEGKRLFGNGMGYEADIYGAVLGFDYTATCGSVLGLAINVGTSDGNSTGNGQKVDNDQDFYGVSAYASRQFGSFNTKLDLGYLVTKNDLKTASSYFGATSEKLDAKVFTVGLGAEFLASAGAVNVVPHAGIRLTTIDMDESNFGADYDKMTVYQLPLGVTFSGSFDAAGWQVAPQFDLSVVPTFGDKDAVATYAGNVKDTTRVVDTNPVQATLGVSAQNGAWTFGLNYGLTAGGDDRMNNSLNANVRYTF
jgi:predicted outer membrane repeat protein